MMLFFRRRVSPGVLGVALAILFATGCASSGRNALPPGTLEPDRFLYERGKAALDDHKWLTAREFFKDVFETYTQSTYRPDAKLGIGDTYMGEGSPGALVSAISEFTEFLTFYPTHPRADYAQYQLALAHFRQMRSAQRDQSETRDAISAFEAFVARYPSSDLMPEARAHLRDAKDRLGDHEYGVGLFYYRINWWAGAIERFQDLLKQDPQYTNRDNVYYYLGEAILKSHARGSDGPTPEDMALALPYFSRLVDEFEQSDHLEDARKRVAELTARVTKSQ
jgi:outer membrane protein assembly factor BamD